MNEIPKHIGKLVTDIDWNKDFIFEDMSCEHAPLAKEHVKVDCQKCQYDKREIWIEEKLNKMTGKETMIDLDKKIKTISRIIIHRGKYDDCIAIQTEFN